MRMLLSFVLLLVIAGTSAYFARQRGRDPVGWFLIALLTGVIGLTVLFLLPKLSNKSDLEQDEDRILAGIPNDNPTSKDWFYLDGNHHQQGPISYQKLRRIWEEGTINSQTLVWSEGMTQWEKIEAIPLLNEVLPVKI